ncbi:DNA-binding protein WhiA [Mycobacteroides abscessus]|uniref:DNA-binding protein WhiA n=1 Tax=Mycobacteroides abscessus TaxID=36809 RepID=UPI0005E4F94A|nr:DNA-binding protein WhiA [Mycobacteroides abscessus]CPW92245.1 sporulation transcription regulator whiA [Mycobacteroides abscessus]SKF42425.1 sporulation transcription regulator whiA [Mycobacteroides abscessus subsp. bolletii]SKH17916.1 sporulation transcription regulator whiA [Mycobacteroides abscessus subsp. bolletii]
MSMTQEVRDEMCRATSIHQGCRRAQVAAIARLTGELRVSRTGLIVHLEVNTGSVARYLRREITALYGHKVSVTVNNETGLRRGARYTVRVTEGGRDLALQIGLIDLRGRPVTGLPAMVVGGSPGEVAAAWRGAFMVAGSLIGPSRSSALEISCPSPEVAYALASCARRLGVQPIVRTARGVDRVTIRDHDNIGVLLTRLGAEESRISWERRIAQRAMQATAIRLVNLDDANARRSARAAAATAAKVEQALAILGSEAPEHLAHTGQLRLDHREASLEELGQLAQPPITKDAVAGRLRRLLTMADRHAAGEEFDEFDPEHPAGETVRLLAGA